MNIKKRSLTGIKPTGIVHLGNYLGTIKPAIARQDEYECFYFIPDLHSLTTMRDAEMLKKASYEIVAVFIACGLNLDNNAIYRQSDIPEVAEFMWYLMCVTGVGLFEKAHAYKDAVASGKEINLGVFNYPALMAADIVMYDTDIVPVGKDQKQHVEIARDMAGSFNSIYGEGLIKLPTPVIDEKVMTIPGLDGRKMSKSYNNTIPLFCDTKTLRKLCLSLVTDSTPLEAPKSMVGTHLGDLFALFATDAEFKDLEARLQKGGLGWGHAKDELYQAIDKSVAPMRKIYDEIKDDLGYLEGVLQKGKEKAKAVSAPVLGRVRDVVGFGR